MHEELRREVEHLFANAPKTKKASELKEEFYSNLCEKYDDLVVKGQAPEDALSRVLSNIGDVNELIDSLEEEIMVIDPEKEAALRKKNALVVTASVLFYVVSLVAVVLMNAFRVPGFVSGSVFLILIAIPTAALVYNYMSQPRYRRQDDTIVEEFKEFTDNASRNKQAWKSLLGAYWCMVTVLYFFLGFFFHAWAWSWLIFILAAAVQQIIKASLALRR